MRIKACHLFISILRLYRRFLSPVAVALGAQCRFYPTCSEYAVEAFERFPWRRAAYLSTKRLLKCGPWHEGGIDKVVTGG
jgi:putative membrane protein insertion efficiency factor